MHITMAMGSINYYAMTSNACATMKLAYNAVHGTQLVQVCYYSITHSSASLHGSHVSPARNRLPALPLQVWLTRLDQDGPPNSTPS